MKPLEMDFFRHGYAFIDVKPDSACARAPQPPRWRTSPEQKHLRKPVVEEQHASNMYIMFEMRKAIRLSILL